MKNIDGHLGPICNSCGGYGYTLCLVGGGSKGCHDCEQTGIAQPTKRELQDQINNFQKIAMNSKQPQSIYVMPKPLLVAGRIKI